LKKIIFSLVTILALGAVANANSLVDGLTAKATDVVKDKAEKKATEVATDQAKKSLKDGSLKEKAIKKATEVADEHTDGKASQAIDAVKSFTK
jgi:hypothetical protein